MSKKEKVIFKRKGQSVKFANGATLLLPQDTSAIFAFGGGIRYLGKVQSGDKIDVESGYVVRNGSNAFKIHCDLGSRNDSRKFFVHPGSLKERLPRALDAIENHWEKIILVRWEQSLAKLKNGETAHRQIDGDYYGTYEKSSRGVSMGSYKIDTSDLTINMKLPSERSLKLGAEIHRAETRLREISGLRQLITNLVIEYVVKPQLPKPMTCDEVVAIKVGGSTFLYQAKLQYAERLTWNLIGQTRKYSAKELGVENDGR